MPNILPVLHANINQLTNPRDIIKSVLRWYMYNPANINDTFHSKEISFIFDSAESTTVDMLVSVATKSLEDTLKRYFSQGSVSVDISYTMRDERRFDLKFDIVVVLNGHRYAVGQDYATDGEGHLAFDYTG